MSDALFGICIPGRLGTSTGFQRQILVRRRVGETGDQPEPRFADPWPDSVDEGELPDRREHRALVDNLLNFVQYRLAFTAIQLDGLLPIQLVDIGVGAVGKNAVLHDMRLDAGGSVAERSWAGLDQILELFLAEAFDKAGALDRPQLGTDADREKVVDHRLGDIGVGRIAIVFAAIEAASEPSFRKKLLCPVRIMHWRRRLPEEIIVRRDDRVATDQRVPK